MMMFDNVADDPEHLRSPPPDQYRLDYTFPINEQLVNWEYHDRRSTNWLANEVRRISAAARARAADIIPAFLNVYNYRLVDHIHYYEMRTYDGDGYDTDDSICATLPETGLVHLTSSDSDSTEYERDPELDAVAREQHLRAMSRPRTLFPLGPGDRFDRGHVREHFGPAANAAPVARVIAVVPTALRRFTLLRSITG